MVEEYLFTFTVFTATYDRADTIHRVYDSLCQQTFRDFEWLIVDDGSADKTEDIVRQWQAEAKFPIHYYWQANRGKASAANYGAQKANGVLFLPLDSDDACVPTALERFYFHWESIPEAQRQKFSAVTALCMDENGQLVGTRFPRDILDSNSAEIRYRYQVHGEKWGFQRTDIMRKYLFPTDAAFPGHIPEGIVWNAIARKYQTRFVNEILRIYYRRNYNTPQQRNQSLASAAIKDPYGYVVWHRSALNNDLRWFRYAPLEFARNAVHFARFSLNSDVSIPVQYSELTNWLAKALWLMMLPLGVFISWRDKLTVGKISKIDPH
jgi:glycosyltransferase involved in cell wall biosynthesis